MGDMREDIEAKLFAAAEARARQNGVTISGDASQDIRMIAKEAADRIAVRAEQKGDNTERYLIGATRVGSEAMATLVDEMTSARFRLPSFAEETSAIIGERTLEAARSILCPLWPICD